MGHCGYTVMMTTTYVITGSTQTARTSTCGKVLTWV